MIKETTADRVVLVRDKRSEDGMSEAPVKRYRLARLKINHLRAQGKDRYAHLKEIYE